MAITLEELYNVIEQLKAGVTIVDSKATDYDKGVQAGVVATAEYIAQQMEVK